MLNTLENKIAILPDNLKSEAISFLDYLLIKNKRSNKQNKRIPGFMKNKIEISDDFDEPIDDFKDYIK